MLRAPSAAASNTASAAAAAAACYSGSADEVARGMIAAGSLCFVAQGEAELVHVGAEAAAVLESTDALDDPMEPHHLDRPRHHLERDRRQNKRAKRQFRRDDDDDSDSDGANETAATVSGHAGRSFARLRPIARVHEDFAFGEFGRVRHAWAAPDGHVVLGPRDQQVVDLVLAPPRARPGHRRLVVHARHDLEAVGRQLLGRDAELLLELAVAPARLVALILELLQRFLRRRRAVAAVFIRVLEPIELRPLLRQLKLGNPNLLARIEPERGDGGRGLCGGLSGARRRRRRRRRRRAACGSGVG